MDDVRFISRPLHHLVGETAGGPNHVVGSLVGNRPLLHARRVCARSFHAQALIRLIARLAVNLGAGVIGLHLPACRED
jgi:hypothetical protein